MHKEPQLPGTVSISMGVLSKESTTLTARKIREMRKDPTIFLARLMAKAPILAAEWTVEADDDLLKPAADFIYAQVVERRNAILSAVMTGILDFGWQPFEIVYRVEDGLVVVKKLKPLLQDLTDIATTEEGDFSGFRQGSDISVPLFNSMLINANVECDNHYGASYMQNAEKAYDASNAVEATAKVYDRKIAGAHWVIRFPDGKSNLNGKETDNAVIADQMIKALESSGSFALPRKTLDALEELNAQSEEAWDIQLLESSGSGANFLERLGRYDKEKVRAFGLPERAVLEGQFGTKAEAEAHGDFALTALQQLGSNIVEQLNTQIVARLLRMNFGIDKGVRLKQQPLTDAALAQVKALYDKILDNADGFLQEYSVLDIEAIRDRLSIPYVSDTPAP